jgi:hypothetical protein
MSELSGILLGAFGMVLVLIASAIFGTAMANRDYGLPWYDGLPFIGYNRDTMDA